MSNSRQVIGELRVRKAVTVLIDNIDAIRNVSDWANEAKVSRRWLCKSMKMTYGKPPKIILREIKYEKVVKLIHKEGLEANCYCVAVDAGFEESKNVSRFLSSFYDTTFTELKMKLLIEGVQIDYLWLNKSRF